MNAPLLENRNYTFLGSTQSLCPECLNLVPAKIIARGKRVYFRKRCPEHGLREDFICSDASWYDRYDYALPAKLPKQTFVEPSKGCPFDCGLCSDHEQHTCIGVLEITDSCNLTCPMCYAGSAPGLKHRTWDEVVNAIQTLVRAEGRPDVLQLSGGEPTSHPQFEAILAYALEQPIQYIMINTNGIRLSHDAKLIELLAEHRGRIEIYLQMDGVSDDVYEVIRGKALWDTKQRALENLSQAGLHTTLVATMQTDVNDHQIGALVDIASSNRCVTGLSFQPATYSGRFISSTDLEKRCTFPDVIAKLCEQSHGRFQASDFFPLPCAHPNCHILSLAYRHDGKVVPLTRFVDAQENLDLLANGLSFNRNEGKRLVELYLNRSSCCGPAGCCDEPTDSSATSQTMAPQKKGLGMQVLAHPTANDFSETARSFFARALTGSIGAEDLLRITITSFLDAYNFDVRRVMKCCTHHVLPTGHIIPFCAYNVLYRNGKVPLPPLKSEILRSR